MKDGACRYRELIPAFITVKLVALKNAGYLHSLAGRAFDSLRPAKCYEKVAALSVSVKVFEQLHEVHGLSICHG